MDIEFDGENVHLRLSRGEASRLATAIEAGCESVSRAEYYIRTGLSEPGVLRIADALKAGDVALPGSATLPLESGIEEVENPRRPRSPQS